MSVQAELVWTETDTGRRLVPEEPWDYDLEDHIASLTTIGDAETIYDQKEAIAAAIVEIGAPAMMLGELRSRRIEASLGAVRARFSVNDGNELTLGHVRAERAGTVAEAAYETPPAVAVIDLQRGGSIVDRQTYRNRLEAQSDLSSYYGALVVSGLGQYLHDTLNTAETPTEERVDVMGRLSQIDASSISYQLDAKKRRR